MNFSKLIYSFFIILIAIFFILLGIIFIMIPWITAIRTHIIQFIMGNSLAISLFGVVFLIIGIAMVMNIILTARHRYYKIRSGPNSITVDETLIQQCLDSYLEELFPGNDVPNRITLKNNRIHVTVNFPHLPLPEQKPLLKRVETDLSNTFETILDYRKEFYLSASFREKEPSS